MAANVENRIARAFPFFNMETLAIVIPTFSVSCVTLIFRLASITSMLMIIAIYLNSEVVFGFNIDGFLEELLKHCRKDSYHRKRKNPEQSVDYGNGRVDFICYVNCVRHARGIECADRECAIFNILYRLYRLIRKSRSEERRVGKECRSRW